MREEQTRSIASLRFSARVQQFRSFLRQQLEPGLAVVQLCPVPRLAVLAGARMASGPGSPGCGCRAALDHRVQLMTPWLFNLETLGVKQLHTSYKLNERLFWNISWVKSSNLVWLYERHWSGLNVDTKYGFVVPAASALWKMCLIRNHCPCSWKRFLSNIKQCILKVEM